MRVLIGFWNAPAMRNGCCRMYGGLSAGPRAPEGLERSRMTRWMCGQFVEIMIVDR